MRVEVKIKNGNATRFLSLAGFRSYMTGGCEAPSDVLCECSRRPCTKRNGPYYRTHRGRSTKVLAVIPLFLPFPQTRLGVSAGSAVPAVLCRGFSELLRIV